MIILSKERSTLCFARKFGTKMRDLETQTRTALENANILYLLVTGSKGLCTTTGEPGRDCALSCHEAHFLDYTENETWVGGIRDSTASVVLAPLVCFPKLQCAQSLPHLKRP